MLKVSTVFYRYPLRLNNLEPKLRKDYPTCDAQVGIYEGFIIPDPVFFRKSFRAIDRDRRTVTKNEEPMSVTAIDEILQVISIVWKNLFHIHGFSKPSLEKSLLVLLKYNVW